MQTNTNLQMHCCMNAASNSDNHRVSPDGSVRTNSSSDAAHSSAGLVQSPPGCDRGPLGTQSNCNAGALFVSMRRPSTGASTRARLPRIRRSPTLEPASEASAGVRTVAWMHICVQATGMRIAPSSGGARMRQCTTQLQRESIVPQEARTGTCADHAAVWRPC
jgi:hypothetical protein